MVANTSVYFLSLSLSFFYGFSFALQPCFELIREGDLYLREIPKDQGTARYPRSTDESRDFCLKSDQGREVASL